MPNPLNYYVLNGQTADIGTAGTSFFTAPLPGSLKELRITLFAAITGADDVVTVSVDGTALAPTLTVPFTGSAAGTTVVASFNAPVRAGSRITVANSGASTGTAAAAYSLTLQG